MSEAQEERAVMPSTAAPAPAADAAGLDDPAVQTDTEAPSPQGPGNTEEPLEERSAADQIPDAVIPGLVVSASNPADTEPEPAEAGAAGKNPGEDVEAPAKVDMSGEGDMMEPPDDRATSQEAAAAGTSDTAPAIDAGSEEAGHDEVAGPAAGEPHAEAGAAAAADKAASPEVPPTQDNEPVQDPPDAAGTAEATDPEAANELPSADAPDAGDEKPAGSLQTDEASVPEVAMSEAMESQPTGAGDEAAHQGQDQAVETGDSAVDGRSPAAAGQVDYGDQEATASLVAINATRQVVEPPAAGVCILCWGIGHIVPHTRGRARPSTPCRPLLPPANATRAFSQTHNHAGF